MGNFVVSGVLARDVYADHLSKLSQGRRGLKGSIHREIKELDSCAQSSQNLSNLWSILHPVLGVQLTSSNVVI